MTATALQVLAEQLERSTDECQRLAQENDQLWWAYELSQGNPYEHLGALVPHPLVVGLTEHEGIVRWSTEIREVAGLLQTALQARAETGNSIWCEALQPDQPARRKAVRPAIARSLRTAVHERDAYRCVACGTHLGLTIDHIVPYSKGGPSIKDNLQTLCAPHNAAKGTKLPAEWASQLEEIRAEAGLPFDVQVDVGRLQAALDAWGPSNPGVEITESCRTQRSN